MMERPLFRAVRGAALAFALACASGGQGPRQQKARPAGSPSRPQLVSFSAPSHATVAVRLFFRSGSADDPPGMEGLTKLTADLMAEGGTERLSASELARALYPMAAELEVVVDKETTVFAGRCPREAVSRFVPVLEDVVQHPRLDEHEFERVKSRAVDAIEKGLRSESDEVLGQQTLSLMLYGGHPYGHFTGGTVQGLKRISLADVRAHLRRVFVASRLTVGAAGGYEGDF
ncbi:MAG TPA: insulinase family protein, partial [Anaeromyxobacteraceae bacterium]|nr:insulinase family protein [Anaeromyxobacteraceae bacterium]